MKKSKIVFKEAFFYRIISSNLSDLTHVNYDIIAFFSPADIRSLFENFPNFKQNKTLVAGFGATTLKAILDANLEPNIQAPTPQTPSMITAVDKFIEAHHKGV
jgi:uroporphyrinogen-III synthase